MASFDLIRIFLAVAQHHSFTQAANSLDISPTAVSKGIRTLEKQHGVALFRRTTRSVSLTDAGANLLVSLKPAMARIEEAFASLGQYRDRPRGRLRLSMPRALGFLVARELGPRMRAAYPDITLDLALDDGIVDLVADGFDAGIRLGQAIAQDMVAIRLSRELAWSVVAAPDYLARHGTPVAPRDLLRHAAIRYRFHTSGVLPPWRFRDDEGSLELEPETAMVANDTRMIAGLALQGLGIAYLPDVEIGDELRQGKLVRILERFVPRSSGLYLYFPARTQEQATMRALIEQARMIAQEGVLDS
ncbi:LysR family transcriptional regulator [Massilia sp. KIM]|uniref:LysR family transcriptional regulator n=1 Tax=Massilia sp. KIM TaxID=1955422 RepID=UPI00098FBA6A|nr:LysR family transcriptional regulator [Massilia sp. KIM]OON60995.1 LysR family transcriptional regulator [Massilia sp. KIM]